jgi:hypothetical protein
MLSYETYVARTPEEQERFLRGKALMFCMYASRWDPFTTGIILHGTPSPLALRPRMPLHRWQVGSVHSTAVLQIKAPKDSNERQYDQSGWCVCEEGNSQLVLGHSMKIELTIRTLRERGKIFKDALAYLRTVTLAVGASGLGLSSFYQLLEDDETKAEACMMSLRCC